MQYLNELIRDLAKRKSKEMWEFWKLTSGWPIPLFVFNKLLITQNISKFAKLHRIHTNPTVSRNIRPVSKWWYIGMACLTGRCRCENDIYILHGMVDVVSAAEFHRSNTRTASDRYQSDIGRYIGPIPEWQYGNYIKMAYLPRFCWCRNKSNSPVSQ